MAYNISVMMRQKKNKDKKQEHRNFIDWCISVPAKITRRGHQIEINWNAYNESGDLKEQVENYKALLGFYTELAQVDKIYATRENRRWFKEKGIRMTAAPLGRPSKQQAESYYQKRKRKKEATERNAIKTKFGQGKNGYNLNQIRAKLRETSESWISCIFFVMNLLKYEKDYFLHLLYRLFLEDKSRIFENILFQNKISLKLAA